ncbi:MAG: glycosyltransferase family 1 protein [Chloroflexota bacterium]|nr:glycosyltransferase family 1 protein [Chloroflexota bacterium]
MHIGIDARLTYYRRGGISTYITRLIESLESLDTANRYTILRSRKDTGATAGRLRQVPIWTPCHHPFERITLSAELMRFNLDLLHTTDFIPPWRGARRHLATIHDLTFLHYPDFLTNESRRYYNDQIAYAVDHADHLLTDSEASKRDLIAMLGVPEDKITVHLLGVDAAFRPLADEAIDAVRRDLSLPDRYFLFVGTWEPRKNLIGLGRAYRHLLDRHPDAPPLLIAGSPGWNFDATRAALDALKLGDRLLWRESVAQDALPALYNGALALVLPSFYEGFGFPALEAMACGTVPIVSDRSSLPEVVGAVGLQVVPEDDMAIMAAMRRVWQDDAWRESQIAAGIARARQFSWETTARIALSVYQRLLSA